MFFVKRIIFCLTGIVIKLKGEAQVHWTETHTDRRHGKSGRRTVHYNGQETYFENRMMVFGRGSKYYH